MDGLWVNVYIMMKLNLIKNVKLEEILNTTDASDFGCFIEVDLKYLDNIKSKTKKFYICSWK